MHASFLPWSAALVMLASVIVPSRSRQSVELHREILFPSETSQYQLTAIGALAISASGLVAVAERSGNEILVFDSRGALRKAFGGTGDGPGQFRRIVDIGFVGDSVWVADPLTQRVSVFMSDGRLLRTMAPTLVSRGTRPSARPLALLSTGAILAAGVVPYGPDSNTTPFIGLGTGGLVDTLLRWRGPSRWALPSTGDGRDAADPPFPQPFESTSKFRFSRYDATVYIVNGAGKAGSSTQRIRVMRQSFDGAILFSSVVVTRSMTVSQEMVDSAIELARMIRPMSRAALRATLIVPDFVDAVTAVVPVLGGGVFLRLQPMGERVKWIMMGSKGDSVATFDLPKSFQGLAAASGTVYGSEPNVDGLPLIVRYRMGK